MNKPRKKTQTVAEWLPCKWNATFVDAEGQKISVKIEQKDGKASFSGDCGAGTGQMQGSIKPATPAQRELLRMWEEWHLNDLQAGTPAQMAFLETRANEWEIVKKTGVSHYDWAKRQLEAAGLSPDKTEGANYGYEYGSRWLTKELPADFNEQITELVETLLNDEENRAGNPLSFDSDDALINFIEASTALSGEDAIKCAALVKMFDLCENDLQDVTIYGNRATVQGVDYLCGDDDEMDEEHEADLNNYLEECVLSELPDVAQRYFDRKGWIEDAKQDGRGHSLNRYDGGEEKADVNGTTYYAYRN